MTFNSAPKRVTLKKLLIVEEERIKILKLFKIINFNIYFWHFPDLARLKKLAKGLKPPKPGPSPTLLPPNAPTPVGIPLLFSSSAASSSGYWPASQLLFDSRLGSHSQSNLIHIKKSWLQIFHRQFLFGENKVTLKVSTP